LIRLDAQKDNDREREKEKEKDTKEDPSAIYSQSALCVSSEAVSLFRFLLKTEEWKEVVEEELFRAIQRLTLRIASTEVVHCSAGVICTV
jgi:hypothetical protein